MRRTKAPLLVLVAGLSPAAVLAQQDCTDIHATSGWRTLQFEAGAGTVVDSISGGWTVDRANFAQVGAAGHTGNAAARLAPFAGFKANQAHPFGALLMHDGNGKVSAVSVGTVMPSSQVQMRINDSDQSLADNAGKLTVCFRNGGGQAARSAPAASAARSGGLSPACQQEDAAIKRQKGELDAWRRELSQERRSLGRERRRLQDNENTLSFSYPTDGNPYAERAYNYNVSEHRRNVNEYNRRQAAFDREVDDFNRESARYNRRVEALNSCR